MITVNTHDAKSRLSQLLAVVESGKDTVLICRNGRPVAELARPSGPKKLDRSRIPPDPGLKILGDICVPLDDEAWPEEFR